MTASKLRHVVLFASLLFSGNKTPHVSAAPLTYKFAGQITDVFQNPNNVIPNLAVGDDFAGHLTFESTGWHHTQGTVFASLNGVDLLFTGSYIYGNVTLGPANRYEISIAGDAGGRSDRPLTPATSDRNSSTRTARLATRSLFPRPSI
jgi:hypothetical protein